MFRSGRPRLGLLYGSLYYDGDFSRGMQRATCRAWINTAQARQYLTRDTCLTECVLFANTNTPFPTRNDVTRGPRQPPTCQNPSRQRTSRTMVSAKRRQRVVLTDCRSTASAVGEWYYGQASNGKIWLLSRPQTFASCSSDSPGLEDPTA